MNYYNENNSFAAQWLRNLITARLIPNGDIDERSITEVEPTDLNGYTQCHFFAGIGGWSLALQLVGWPADRPVWTGSCPCQPYSVSGKQKGKADDRDLWPTWFELIKKCKPATIFGEQVANSIKHGWLDRVYLDMEAKDYAVGAAILPACSVDAPHLRERLWFVANGKGVDSRRLPVRTESEYSGLTGDGKNVPHAAGVRRKQGQQAAASTRHGNQLASEGSATSTMANSDLNHSHWGSGTLQVGWNCIEGEITRRGRKYRAQWRTKPGLGLLAYGVPGRVGRLRAYGNAIVPQVAAEFIKAYMSC